jgi:hypothetical protein
MSLFCLYTGAVGLLNIQVRRRNDGLFSMRMLSEQKRMLPRGSNYSCSCIQIFLISSSFDPAMAITLCVHTCVQRDVIDLSPWFQLGQAQQEKHRYM